MPKPVYPENFDTEIIDEGFYVTDDRGTVAAISNMGSLANKLLNNEKVDAYDRAMAGAIIKHFIALSKPKKKRRGPLQIGEGVQMIDIDWPNTRGWTRTGILMSTLTTDDNGQPGYYVDVDGVPARAFIYRYFVRRSK
jgi:hypothetical protein